MSKIDWLTTPGEVKEAVNFLCVKCNKVYKTPQGLMAHFYHSHKIRPNKVRYDKHWKTTKRKADY